jgi:hypothetical protein
MKIYKTSSRFWIVLGLINVLAMAYPISLFQSVENSGGNIVSVLVLFVVMFVLLITDVISIAIAYLD